jgi:hypothetical protein
MVVSSSGNRPMALAPAMPGRGSPTGIHAERCVGSRVFVGHSLMPTSSPRGNILILALSQAPDAVRHCPVYGARRDPRRHACSRQGTGDASRRGDGDRHRARLAPAAMLMRRAGRRPGFLLGAAAWNGPSPVCCHGAGCCWQSAKKPDPPRRGHQPGPSGVSGGAASVGAIGVARILSMRLPSRSTTSSRQFSQVSTSPVCGNFPDSHITRPLSVW